MSRLVCQIDQMCLGLPAGPIFVAKATTFAIGAESNRLPIKTKLGIGTHVDPGSVLVKVKVKVIWHHLVNADKTPSQGPRQ